MAKSKSANVRFTWAAQSDRGKVRQGNEDAFAVDQQLGLFVVSDGMGGHPAGEVAAELTAELLPAKLQDKLGGSEETDDTEIVNIIKQAIVEVNADVVDQANQGKGQPGMGATLVMAFLTRGRVYVANVGDSRIYILRDNQMLMVSQEHSAAAEALGQQWASVPIELIDPSLAGITRYIGIEAEPVKPYVAVEQIKPGDKILLCSDGLTDMVHEEFIEEIISGTDNCQSAVEQLIAAANEAGGVDNITIVLVNVGE